MSSHTVRTYHSQFLPSEQRKSQQVGASAGRRQLSPPRSPSKYPTTVIPDIPPNYAVPSDQFPQQPRFQESKTTYFEDAAPRVVHNAFRSIEHSFEDTVESGS